MKPQKSPGLSSSLLARLEDVEVHYADDDHQSPVHGEDPPRVSQSLQENQRTPATLRLGSSSNPRKKNPPRAPTRPRARRFSLNQAKTRSLSFSLHRRLSPPPTITKKKKPKDKPPCSKPSVSTTSPSGPAASAPVSFPSSPPSTKSSDISDSKLSGPVNAPASSCPVDLQSFPPLVVDEYGKPTSQISATEVPVPEEGTNKATSEHLVSGVHPQTFEHPADVRPCSPKTNLQLQNQQGAKVQASLWKEKVSPNSGRYNDLLSRLPSLVLLVLGGSYDLEMPAAPPRSKLPTDKGCAPTFEKYLGSRNDVVLGDFMVDLRCGNLGSLANSPAVSSHDEDDPSSEGLSMRMITGC
ncbi:hypothetical protein Bca52824_018758 [Brassica carinata]|uniref:Uncharacterized protein n=1 Tax=Brassica carinata TaxID=52824 RepID=A0A8X7VQJ8_BRACI|nr:hypothetical protein Bca52824_018758 [Brassica carinata]